MQQLSSSKMERKCNAGKRIVGKLKCIEKYEEARKRANTESVYVPNTLDSPSSG
jgi:hypothetical protein